MPADPRPDPAPAGLVVRQATLADAAACARIYAPYVTGTAVSFEEAPPTPDQMAGRIATALAGHAWLVGQAGDEVVGYAYGGRFRERPAYRWSCETTIYLRTGLRRTGAGRTLYGALLGALATLGYRQAFAGVTLPNEASVGLHHALGFADVGVLRRVGFKDGRWHDVAWLQRPLGAGGDAPPAPPA